MAVLSTNSIISHQLTMLEKGHMKNLQDNSSCCRLYLDFTLQSKYLNYEDQTNLHYTHRKFLATKAQHQHQDFPQQPLGALNALSLHG